MVKVSPSAVRAEGERAMSRLFAVSDVRCKSFDEREDVHSESENGMSVGTLLDAFHSLDSKA